MTSLATVRAAGPDDAEALVALVNTAFMVERSFVDRDRTTLDEIRACVGRGTFLVADAGVGSLAACVYVEARGERAYLGMLAVDPARQGRGLGRDMMAAAESHCRALGCRAIDIRIVDRRLELPPFYRSLGFSDTGTSPVDDPSATKPYHFVLMSKALTP